VHHDRDASRDLEKRLVTLGHEVAAVVTSAEAATQAAPLRPELVVEARGSEGETTALLLHHPLPALLPAGEVMGSSPPRDRPTDPQEVLSLPCTDRELHLALELAHCRYETSRALHEQHQFFDTSHDMFCFLDFNGYFRRLNPAWERTLGFTRAELISRPFITFVHPDDRERTLEQNARVRAGGQAMGFENRYLCRDGSVRWFLWNATPQSLEQVIYSVARDVTTEKQAEAERTELVRELEVSLAEVSALQDILPICSYCRKIRDDEDFWHSVENYISRHTKSRFSHGICPSCMETEVEPDLGDPEAP